MSISGHLSQRFGYHNDVGAEMKNEMKMIWLSQNENTI